MATGLITALANSTLDAILAAHPYVKLHVGSPGAAGTSNAATETTRKLAAWAASSGGTAVTSADLDWTAVAATEDYTHWSAWTASSGGTCGFTGELTGNSATAGGNYHIEAGDLAASFPVAA